MGVNLLGYNTLDGLDQEGSIRDRSVVLKTSGSRVGFLITGVTLAVLRVEGTLPVNIDELMILVIGSTRTSRQSFSIHVGSGSSVQDFVDEFMMISLVVSGVIVEKFVNMLEHNCVGMSTDSCDGI